MHTLFVSLWFFISKSKEDGLLSNVIFLLSLYYVPRLDQICHAGRRRWHWRHQRPPLRSAPVVRSQPCSAIPNHGITKFRCNTIVRVNSQFLLAVIIFARLLQVVQINDVECSILLCLLVTVAI